MIKLKIKKSKVITDLAFFMFSWFINIIFTNNFDLAKKRKNYCL